jgi:hypothetical protein
MRIISLVEGLRPLSDSEGRAGGGSALGGGPLPRADREVDGDAQLAGGVLARSSSDRADARLGSSALSRSHILRFVHLLTTVMVDQIRTATLQGISDASSFWAEYDWAPGSMAATAGYPADELPTDCAVSSAPQGIKPRASTRWGSDVFTPSPPPLLLVKLQIVAAQETSREIGRGCFPLQSDGIVPLPRPSNSVQTAAVDTPAPASRLSAKEDAVQPVNPGFVLEPSLEVLRRTLVEATFDNMLASTSNIDDISVKVCT